jgi:hypothetical protein
MQACLESQWKKWTSDYIRRESWHHAQHETWRHSGGSLTQMCRTYDCSATTWPYSCPLCGTYSRTSVRCEKPNYEWWWWGMSTPRADRLLGLPLTIIHGMWLVLSNTWPQLPHILTLSTFIHTDGVTFQVMIPHMTLSIILIVIAE